MRVVKSEEELFDGRFGDILQEISDDIDDEDLDRTVEELREITQNEGYNWYYGYVKDEYQEAKDLILDLLLFCDKLKGE